MDAHCLQGHRWMLEPLLLRWWLLLQSLLQVLQLLHPYTQTYSDLVGAAGLVLGSKACALGALVHPAFR